MEQELINKYLDLVSEFLKNSTIENEDAIEALEEAHPGLADAVYQAGGPYEYDLLTNTVKEKRK